MGAQRKRAIDTVVASEHKRTAHLSIERGKGRSRKRPGQDTIPAYAFSEILLPTRPHLLISTTSPKCHPVMKLLLILQRPRINHISKAHQLPIKPSKPEPMWDISYLNHSRMKPLIIVKCNKLSHISLIPATAQNCSQACTNNTLLFSCSLFRKRKRGVICERIMKMLSVLFVNYCISC